MSTKVSEFKNYIRGLIQQELKELEEASVTGALDGGEGPPRTPYAFSGGRKKDKDKKKKITQAAGYTKVHESVNEGQKKQASVILRKFDMAYIKFSQEVRDVMKLMDKSTGSKVDGKIIEKAYGKHLIPFDDLMQSWAKGQQENPGLSESVNEQSKVIKSIDNLAKKNKYGTVTGTQMNGKTANMIMKIYNHPKMKRRQKDLDNLTSDELTNLTIDRDVIRILGLNEGKYHDYRNDESMTPKQKIGSSMREVRNSLNELSKLIDMNVKLKNELNVNSQSYWKNTHKALNKIGERLVKLANKVGQLQ
jgi:hypothetical protein